MEPLADAIRAGLAEFLRGAPLSPGKVEFAWKAAVGPAMQRISAVRLEQTVLLVDAATRHWAKEINRSAHVILPRMQALLGKDTVKEIRVRQN